MPLLQHSYIFLYPSFNQIKRDKGTKLNKEVKGSYFLKYLVRNNIFTLNSITT